MRIVASPETLSRYGPIRVVDVDANREIKLVVWVDDATCEYAIAFGDSIKVVKVERVQFDLPIGVAYVYRTSAGCAC